ncbi:MAG: NAD(P)H-hydrate dehydratase [Chitinophagales bacterium]|nr:NAD(P)H-hydrate dehydratase [Chitinophagales bacterium]
MKLISGNEFKKWDQFTIEEERIASIDLMERASQAFVDEFIALTQDRPEQLDIICGKGNNGGDGLAIARICRALFLDVHVHILDFMPTASEDFDINLKRLYKLDDVPVTFYTDTFPEISKNSIIIDAILGTGVNKPVIGMLASWIDYINTLPNRIISVDMPSGLPTEGVAMGTAIRSNAVITFQLPKLSFFLRENDMYCPFWKVVDIGLSAAYYETIEAAAYWIDKKLIRKIHQPRGRHTHKGNYGHALIIAGSEGKIGAAILATLGCLRSGAGLVTTTVPECGREIIHETIPEAMVLSKGYTCFNGSIKNLSSFSIGLGPGLGTHDKTVASVKTLLKSVEKPMVIDADGLNILAMNPELLLDLPAGSILTPHFKEFQRLFGAVDTEVEMISRAIEIAKKYQWILVLKGAYSRIITPEGEQYINSTGNPGMATAGSGDVLTGVITGLMAQGLKPNHAAILGVYLHGLAGNLALKQQSVESLIAGDIVRTLGAAFNRIRRKKYLF